MWSVECEVRSVKCKVWSVKCKGWSVECRVWSAAPATQNDDRDLQNAAPATKTATHLVKTTQVLRLPYKMTTFDTLSNRG